MTLEELEKSLEQTQRALKDQSVLNAALQDKIVTLEATIRSLVRLKIIDEKKKGEKDESISD